MHLYSSISFIFSVFDHRQGDWARFSPPHPSPDKFFLSISAAQKKKSCGRNSNWRHSTFSRVHLFDCTYLPPPYLPPGDLPVLFGHFMGGSFAPLFCCTFLSRFHSQNFCILWKIYIYTYISPLESTKKEEEEEGKTERNENMKKKKRRRSLRIQGDLARWKRSLPETCFIQQLIFKKKRWI